MSEKTTGEAAEKVATGDPRITQLERERETPLTPEQRERLPDKLRSLDDSIAALQRYALRDGGSEPAFVFMPERKE